MSDTLTLEELENEHVEELPSMDMMGGIKIKVKIFIGIFLSDASLKRDIRPI